MKQISVLLGFLISLCLFAGTLNAQTPVSAFPETSITLNLSPITLPGLKSTLAGAETDVLIAPSPTFALGESTIASSGMFFTGGRANYIVQPISKWLQNHSTNLNGYQFQFGLTGSLGVVKPIGANGAPHWGERAGVFVNYAINGNWGTGIEAQWGNFPGIQHNTWTLAFGPNFHF